MASPGGFEVERDQIIRAQQDEIAALRQQLSQAGISNALASSPSTQKSIARHKFASTDGHDDTHAFYDMDTNRYSVQCVSVY